MTIAAWMRAASLVATTTLIAGCISYQSERERVDADIPDTAALAAITLGETTADWLVEQFGHPSAVRRPSATVAIWQYENVKRSTTRMRALPLFAVELSDTDRTVYHFEVENDFIVRFWKDSAD